MFKKIVTLALCPTLDTTIWLDALNKGEENQAVEERYDASGKAVNLSRIFTDYGVENTCILLLGRENKTRYLQQLDKENIAYRLVEVDGYTRENLSLVENNRCVTRIIRKGFTVEYQAVEQVLSLLDELVCEGTLLMVSGRLPEGISPKVLGLICSRAKERGAEISLDCQSLNLEETAAIAPWIIKPNHEEFCKLLGEACPSEPEAIAQAAAKVLAKGLPRLLVSLGGDGLLYADQHTALYAQVPAVEVRSTVGAGDSSLAGFVKSYQSRCDLERCLATAAAFGTSACMLEGTQPPHKLTVGNILRQITVRKV